MWETLKDVWKLFMPNLPSAILRHKLYSEMKTSSNKSKRKKTVKMSGTSLVINTTKINTYINNAAKEYVKREQ